MRDVLERELSPDERALLILRYLHGLDSVELGEVFGASPEAIRQRLSRTRRRLVAAAELGAAPEPGLRPRGVEVTRAVAGDWTPADDLLAAFLVPLARVVRR